MTVIGIFLKLWPAIKDTLFGGLKFSSYFRRNKAIALLVLALFFSLGSFLYMYEQAFLHGVISKKKSQQIELLTKKISDNIEQSRITP